MTKVSRSAEVGNIFRVMRLFAMTQFCKAGNPHFNLYLALDPFSYKTKTMKTQRDMTQREIFFGQALTPPEFAPKYVIDSFQSYREAVVWCWDNRVRQGAGKNMDQALCANFIGLHTPHMSRCVDHDSKGPMNLPPDMILDFEAFTGWRAVSQYLAARSQLTFMEEVQEMMKSRTRGVQQCA